VNYPDAPSRNPRLGFKSGRFHGGAGGRFRCRAPGETLGVIGESGLGQNHARRFRGARPARLRRGRISIGGRPLDRFGQGGKAAAALRRQIQVVFQDPAFSSLSRRA